MPMNPRRKLAVLGIAAAVAAGAWLGWTQLRAPSAVPTGSAARPAGLLPMAAPKTVQPKDDVVLAAQDRSFLLNLREKFAGRLQSKHTQIKLIEQLIAYLQHHYPDDWQSRMRAFLRELFPELADALHDKFDQLLRYNDWLRGNRETLTGMSPAERRQAMWAARQEAFGADAEEIFAAQRQGEQVRDALAGIETMQGAPVEQKLDAYVQAIERSYGPNAAAVLENRGTELMNGFLAVDSVQEDLHALPATERGAALHSIRRSMGMDEAALGRWDELDRDRDATWDKGQAYMSEREKIQREHDGAEEEEQMRTLQERQFGDEAETIRSEEAAGFYRYGQRRRYGRE